MSGEWLVSLCIDHRQNGKGNYRLSSAQHARTCAAGKDDMLAAD